MRMKNNLTYCILLAACALPARTQTITTVAGNSSWGLVYNVSADSAGNIYVADQTKHSVYKIDTLGSTTIVAGTGAAGYSGDGALATAAKLNQPLGTAVTPDGTLYIADYANDRIRKVAPNGIITTVAGSVGGFSGDGAAATAAHLNGPISLALNSAGDLYFTDVNNRRQRHHHHRRRHRAHQPLWRRRPCDFRRQPALLACARP
jgi:sugar lactone lactonase YvrE